MHQEILFASIFSSSKEQSFIILSLLISHKTIGGSLAYTCPDPAACGWLTTHCFPMVGCRLPFLSPTVLLVLISCCLSSSLHPFSLSCAFSNLFYSSFQPPTLSLYPLSTCQLFFPSPPPLHHLIPSKYSLWLATSSPSPPATEITVLAQRHWRGNLRCVVNTCRGHSRESTSRSSCQCRMYYLSTRWHHHLRSL